MTTTETKLTPAEYMPVANEIVRQLGRGFSVITGAKNFIGLPDQRGGVMFRLPMNGNPKRISHVRIILNWMDMYDVEFLQVRGGRNPTVTVVQSVSDVYCDQLLDVFEAGTGLWATLHPRD